jgi:hypothetical protein
MEVKYCRDTDVFLSIYGEGMDIRDTLFKYLNDKTATMDFFDEHFHTAERDEYGETVDDDELYIPINLLDDLAKYISIFPMHKMSLSLSAKFDLGNDTQFRCIIPLFNSYQVEEREGRNKLSELRYDLSAINDVLMGRIETAIEILKGRTS